MAAMEPPEATLLQNIKRRQEAEGGLVKRRLLTGGAIAPIEPCAATTAAAAAAAERATEALRTSAIQPIERTPNRVTTPLRVYTRKSHRRSLSSDRTSVVSVNSQPSPPHSDSEEAAPSPVRCSSATQAAPSPVRCSSATQAAPSPVRCSSATQAKTRRSLAENERPPATPQRRSMVSGKTAKEAAEFLEVLAGEEVAPSIPAPASPVAAPASPTSVQRSKASESCSICCEDIPGASAVRLSCGHGWYCFQCLKRHAEARLEMGSVDVCCPQCNAAIAERTLRLVLPDTLVEQLLKRSLEQAVSAVGDLYACPTPNCSFRVALEDGDIPRLKCPQCKKTCCLLCGQQPYHRGKTCQEAAAKSRRDSGEAALKRWMEDTGSKQCPTCHAIVTKQNLDKQNTQYVECHKMMCRNCETKFCFKCLKLLSGRVVCNCSRNEHGFIHPKTGRRLNHVKPKAKAKTKR